MDTLNKNLKTLRKLEGIKSQAEFGSRIGVPSHNINKYENNVIPKPEVLRKIAEVFQVNLHLFLTTELTEKNYEQFKMDHNTEAKLESLVSEATDEFKISRRDLEKVASFFANKLERIEEDNLNEIDRKKLFRDVRSIFVAYNSKLEEFYTMQDNLAMLISERKFNQP